MKIKKIKQLLSELYYLGIYNGVDMQRGRFDRFMGNNNARVMWEKEKLETAYQALKELISLTK